MSQMNAYAANTSEVELRGLWAYLSALPPQPTGE